MLSGCDFCGTETGAAAATAGGGLVELIRHRDFDPSSVTRSEPSGATVTPTGLPQTCPLSTTKPVMKSSYAPVARPDLSSGTRISSYPTRTDRFHEPCSAANMSPRYSAGNCWPL